MNLIECKEISPRVPRFSEVALAATFAQNRHLDGSVKKIDLGSLIYEAQLLRNFTVNDPEKREASKLILITNNMEIPGGNNKVVIERETRLGDALAVPWSLEMLAVEAFRARRSLSKKQRQDKFVVTSLHTHYVESPPSPGDLTHILVDDIEDPKAETCCFVAGPDFNYLVFRSSQTPQVGKYECPELKDALSMSWLEKKQGLKKLKGARPEEEISQLEADLRQEFFNGIIRDYGLIVFTGRADSRVVSRVTG